MKRIQVFSIVCSAVSLLFVPFAIGQQSTNASNSESALNYRAGSISQGRTGFGVVHPFKGPDGADPTAALIMDSAGDLYGTTISGGTGSGVVFKISGKKETVLYSFSGGDGANPTSRLLLDAASGSLYGTTYAGGGYGGGTVFKLDKNNVETVVHSFGGPDGANPSAGVVMDSVGNLYGTTQYGGTAGLGTIFEIDIQGNETVLHSFTGTPDGANPTAGVTLDPTTGNLYGTTFNGGSTGDGTVFELDTTGTLTILHNFTGGSDGANPFGGVIRDASGVLYGTAENGGSNHRLFGMQGAIADGHYGCCAGIAYSLAGGMNEPLAGSNLTVLYTFTGNKDGGNPACDLILSNGVLYGTTLLGGPIKNPKGTMFSINVANKTETVLHGFKGAGDGANPQAGLVMNNAGVLFGTAFGGGKNQKGTVFEYTPR